MSCRVLFLSDMHLGAAYIADARAHEARVVDVLRREGSSASHIYLLGDVLDYWFEYRNVVPRGHVRFFGELARLADSGVAITWLTGNHDIWLFDYLRTELGIEVVDAPCIERRIAGKTFVLAHGDRIGSATPGFRFICSMFRNRVCQRLFAAIHPRLTVPFALRWSGHSRYKGRDGAATDAHRAAIIADATALAGRYPEADYIIEGHHHLAMQQPLAGTRATLTVLGDWLARESYAIFDGTNLKVEGGKCKVNGEK